MKILILAIICLYLAINIVIAKMMDAKEMKKHFIDGQCIIGRVAANVFYTPAWLLKFIRIIVVNGVK